MLMKDDTMHLKCLIVIVNLILDWIHTLLIQNIHVVPMTLSISDYHFSLFGTMTSWHGTKIFFLSDYRYTTLPAFLPAHHTLTLKTKIHR
jgi:hypothetical protein